MLVFSPDGLQQCFKVGKDVPLVSYNCDQLKLGRQIPNPRFSILLAVSSSSNCDTTGTTEIGLQLQILSNWAIKTYIMVYIIIRIPNN